MAGRIPDRDIAAIRERIRIEDVVGDYVQLKRAGADSLKGLCPFHNEKSPSFHVRPNHGQFHCFGCGEGGDVYAFVQKIEHVSFVEAVELLADRVGYTVTYTGGAATNVQRDRGSRSRLRPRGSTCSIATSICRPPRISAAGLRRPAGTC